MNQGLPLLLRPSLLLCMAGAIASLFGCEAHHRTFHFVSPDMEASFQRWKETAPPKDRKTIERLEEDDTVIIHVVPGVVSHLKSRGGQTAFAFSKEAKPGCMMRHPWSFGIDWNRNFDIIYDEELMQQAWGFPNPVEAFLHHELIGHVARILDDPTSIEDPEPESYAIERENEYRQYVGLELVPVPKALPPAMKKRKP